MNTINVNPVSPGNSLADPQHSPVPNGSETQPTERFPQKPYRILVPVSLDFNEATRWTLHHAAHLAAEFGSAILLLHVVDMGSFMNDLRNVPLAKPEDQLLRDAEAELRWLAHSQLPGIEPASLMVTAGRVGPEIIRTARANECDLILLSVDNRRAAERILHFIFGSTAAWIERHAPCPVLTLSLSKGTSGPLEYKPGLIANNGILPQLRRVA